MKNIFSMYASVEKSKRDYQSFVLKFQYIQIFQITLTGAASIMMKTTLSYLAEFSTNQYKN